MYHTHTHTHTHTGLPALLVIPQTNYKIFSSSFTLSPSSSSNWIWIKMAFPFLLCFFFVWLKTDLPREITVSDGEKSHLRKNVFTNPKQQSPSPSHPPSLPPLSRPFFFFLYVHLIAQSRTREKRDWDHNPPRDVRADRQGKTQRVVSSHSLSLAVCFWITTGLAGACS